jgi:hypothetical protein
MYIYLQKNAAFKMETIYTHTCTNIQTICTCICIQRQLLRWKLAFVEGILEPYTITTICTHTYRNLYWHKKRMLLRWKLCTHIHVLIYTLYVHIFTYKDSFYDGN